MRQANIKHDEERPSFLDLHHSFDILLSSFIEATGKLPSKTPIIELLQWIYQQSRNEQHGI